MEGGSLAMSAGANTAIYEPIWSSYMHKSFRFLDFYDVYTSKDDSPTFRGDCVTHVDGLVDIRLPCTKWPITSSSLLSSGTDGEGPTSCGLTFPPTTEMLGVAVHTRRRVDCVTRLKIAMYVGLFVHTKRLARTKTGWKLRKNVELFRTNRSLGLEPNMYDIYYKGCLEGNTSSNKGT
jgi:hypothetical protein